VTATKETWREWTSRYVDSQDPVSLFAINDDQRVEYKRYGNDDRRILKRSAEMDALIREEGRRVLNDWYTTDDTYHGLIYLMYWLDDDGVVPLYVGKAGKYGRDGERLSANIKTLKRNSTGKFARWGDGHDYHVGDLSAAIFDYDKTRSRSTEDGRSNSSPRGDDSDSQPSSGSRRGSTRMLASRAT
jgi:hypothetical protein